MANKLAPYKDKDTINLVKKFALTNGLDDGYFNVAIIEQEFYDDALYFNYLKWVVDNFKLSQSTMDRVLNKSQFFKVWEQHVEPFWEPTLD